MKHNEWVSTTYVCHPFKLAQNLSFSVPVYQSENVITLPSVLQWVRALLYPAVLQKAIEYLTFPRLSKQGLDYYKIFLEILSSGSFLLLVWSIPYLYGNLSSKCEVTSTNQSNSASLY